MDDAPDDAELVLVLHPVIVAVSEGVASARSSDQLVGQLDGEQESGNGDQVSEDQVCEEHVSKELVPNMEQAGLERPLLLASWPSLSGVDRSELHGVERKEK